jgi:fatty-acid peroxygenase
VRPSRRDDTITLLRHGYPFISERAHRLGADVFETRILLRPTICMFGSAAARVFYDDERFIRRGAMPMRVQKTLLGQGGVQGLDGAQHGIRKGMLLSFLHPNGGRELGQQFADDLRSEVARWNRDGGRVVLIDAVAVVLMRSVCAWAGVPLAPEDERRRTNEMLAMIDAPAAVGPRHWRGRRARRKANAWAADLVRRYRAEDHEPPAGTPLAVIAGHRDSDNRLLDPEVAGVELLNVLRPTVAVNRFVAFAALALHDHPAWVERLRDSSPDMQQQDLEAFVLEVRRFYPFFPAAAARVRHDFEWKGITFSRGQSVLLDLYGTNHDPRIWERPGEFRPERFSTGEPDAYELVPQGAGEHGTGHRCAGEWATIEILKAAVLCLVRDMDYDVPAQDLSIPLSRMPTAPRSGFVIGDVRRTS